MSEISFPIELQSPPAIMFGAGVANRVGGWIAKKQLKSALIVSDTFNASRTDRLNVGIDAVIFSDFSPEPDASDLERLLEVATKLNPDVVIGYGGGSAMDLAKLAAVLPGGDQHYLDIVGAEKAKTKRRMLVQVPTTSGTGSEAGTRSLVTDPKSKGKFAVQSEHMLADLAVVDPELTVSLPRAVTVATGVDALAHCVEAFTNKKSHPIIDLYAMEGIRLVGKWLPIAAEDGSNKEARAAMALASLYGGFCLGPVNTAAGHAVAYPLGTRHHIPHGAANALIFPHVLAFNAPVVPSKTAQVLGALGLPVSSETQEVFAAAYKWCSDLGCKMKLSDYQVPVGDLEVMANEAHAIRRLLDNNPKEISRSDILEMYQSAY